MYELIQLIILFVVIFDPALSLGIFATATKHLKTKEKAKIALLAIGVAAGLSYVFLFFGTGVLTLFKTTIDNFRVAGGIILMILGINMVLGRSSQELEKTKQSSAAGVAAIIGTPLLTGPAAITAILISAEEFGKTSTGLAVGIVLAATGILLFFAEKVLLHIGPTSIRVLSTLLGLVTLSWGVEFIRAGLGF